MRHARRSDQGRPAWLNSPEHRAIILSSRYHLVGIGRAYGTFLGYPGASVWTVDWGHR